MSYNINELWEQLKPLVAKDFANVFQPGKRAGFTMTPDSYGLERLNSNRTYYVRTDGNDNNDGLANTSSRAFKTIQRAIDAAYQINWNGYQVTIQVADGTYNEYPNASGRPVGAAGKSLYITGNTSNPSAVQVQGFTANLGAYLSVNYVRLTHSSTHQLQANVHSFVDFSNVVFTSTTGAHIYAFRSFINTAGPYYIAGGAWIHWWNQNGYIGTYQKTITFQTNCSFSGYFAFAERNAYTLAAGNTYSYGGYSVTGTRYFATGNSTIQTNGQTLPGSVNGSTAYGGQYF